MGAGSLIIHNYKYIHLALFHYVGIIQWKRKSKALTPLIFIFAMIFTPLASAKSITVTDDMGNAVSIPKTAERIVALAPHVTELLFSLGLGDKIVATVEYADYPPAAKKIPRIGDSLTINIEDLIALKPDLIVAWGSGTSQSLIQRLKVLQIPIYLSGSKNLDDIPSSLLRLGELTGKDDMAVELAQKFRRDLSKVKMEKIEPEKKLFIQIWGLPLRTIGGTHVVDELIQHCGAVNVYNDLSQLSPVVSVESLLNRDPDIIVLSTKDKGFSSELSNLIKPWKQISALKNGAICRIDFDILLRPTMRVLNGINELCKCIAVAN